MTRKHAIKAPAVPNVFEAFKLAVYRYGVAELAAQLGYRPGTLYNAGIQPPPIGGRLE